MVPTIVTPMKTPKDPSAATSELFESVPRRMTIEAQTIVARVRPNSPRGANSRLFWDPSITTEPTMTYTVRKA